MSLSISDQLKLAVSGLSPTAIAEKAGISRTLVYHVRDGKPVNVKTAQAIIDACAELKKERK